MIQKGVTIMEDMDRRATRIADKLYAAYGTDTGVLFGITDRSIIESIIRFTLERAIKNLCLDCKQCFATCYIPDSIVFGEGIGNDNVIECSGWSKRG